MADAVKTYYAWTIIPVDVNEWGKVTSRKQPGDKVTAKDLKLSDEQFKELVDAGSVRTQPYPDMGNFDGSPVEFRKDQLARAAAGEIDWEEITPTVSPTEQVVAEQNQVNPA